MKNYLLLFFCFTLSFGNVNAQSEEGKVFVSSCDVTSNFSYSKLTCNTLTFKAIPDSNSVTKVLGYFWDFGDGITSTNQNPTHNYSANGNYTATLTIIGFNSTNGNCCNDVSTKRININCVQDCGVSINAIEELNEPGKDNLAFSSPSQLNPGWNITSSVFVLTYRDNSTTRHNGFVNFLGNPQISTLVPCTNRVKKVEVTVYVANSSGVRCSDTKTKYFRYGVCGTREGFEIKQNPVRNILDIDIDKSKLKNKVKTELVIYNLNGNIEQKKLVRFNEVKKSLDVSNLKSGMYMLKLLRNNKVIDSQKIVVSSK